MADERARHGFPGMCQIGMKAEVLVESGLDDFVGPYTNAT